MGDTSAHFRFLAIGSRRAAGKQCGQTEMTLMQSWLFTLTDRNFVTTAFQSSRMWASRSRDENVNRFGEAGFVECDRGFLTGQDDSDLLKNLSQQSCTCSWWYCSQTRRRSERSLNSEGSCP